MNEIIAISKTTINGTEVNSVNARDIHSYLEIGTHLSTWIKRAIDKYDFKENSDFSILKSGNPNGGIDIIDYITTLDMAKELCLISDTPKGKEVRKYFIEVEKLANKPMSIEQLLAYNMKVINELETNLITVTHNYNTAITQIVQDKPLVTYAHAVSGSVNPVTIREWVSSLKSDLGLKVGERIVIAYLIEERYLYRTKKNELRAYAEYYETAENKKGYFSLIPIVIATPKGNKEVMHLKITGLGQLQLGNEIVEYYKD